MFSEKLIYHASPATKLGDTKTAPNTYWTIVKALTDGSTMQ